MTSAGAPIDILLVVREPSRERKIVARNAFGDEVLLFRTGRVVAAAKRARVEAELRSMPLDEWCALYGVDREWCHGDPAAVAAADDPRSIRNRVRSAYLLATAVFVLLWWRAIVPLGWAEATGAVAFWLVVMAVSYPVIGWHMKITLLDSQ